MRLILIGLLGLAACGEEPGQQRSEPFLPPTTTRNPPVRYFLADPECQNSADPVALSTTTIYGRNGFSLTSAPQDIRSLRTELSLRGDLIGRTYYNAEFVQTQRCDKNGCPDKGGWEQSRSPRALRVCDDKRVYPRESYEAVALTSGYYLERAGGRYRELSGSDELPPLNLLVLPEIKTFFTNITSEKDPNPRTEIEYEVHNLSYWGEKQTIIIFPESPRFDPQTKGSLWESQFTLAHEFGHHVDVSLSEVAAQRLGLTWNPFAHVFEAASGSPAGLRLAAVNGAIAEAFADLIAFYTDGGTDDGIIGIECFGYNRAVARKEFYDGTPKQLTPSVAEALFGPRQQSDCNVPNFSDIHAVGAVISHGMHEVFSAAVAGLNADREMTPFESAAKIYPLVVQWVRHVHQDFEEHYDELLAGDYPDFRPIAVGVTKTLEPTLAGPELAAVRQRVCQLTREFFPVAAVDSKNKLAAEPNDECTAQ